MNDYIHGKHIAHQFRVLFSFLRTHSSREFAFTYALVPDPYALAVAFEHIHWAF